MRAMDVMTTNVITVSPDTPVQEVAKILSERSISGVPVVEPIAEPGAGARGGSTRSGRTRSSRAPTSNRTAAPPRMS
jgi:CBS-domain-containing membrane protein